MFKNYPAQGASIVYFKQCDMSYITSVTYYCKFLNDPTLTILISPLVTFFLLGRLKTMQQHADVLDSWVKQVMQFYKGIPGFTDLPLKDQMALIKGTVFLLNKKTIQKEKIEKLNTEEMVNCTLIKYSYQLLSGQFCFVLLFRNEMLVAC